MTDDVLGHLVGRSPSRVLEDLAVIGLALATNGRPRPEIEIFLTGGAVIRGRIVSVVADRMGAVALVQLGGSLHAPSVSFVRIDQIAAVTIVDASLLVRGPVSDAPVPSRLELQRQAVAAGQTFTAKFGRALPVTVGGDLDEDGRRAVGILLPVLFEVIAAISSDDMGKAALAPIASIDLGAATIGEVSKADPPRLVVQAPKLLTESFSFASLRTAIEKLL